jgi:hypothetical protein
MFEQMVRWWDGVGRICRITLGCTHTAGLLLWNL